MFSRVLIVLLVALARLACQLGQTGRAERLSYRADSSGRLEPVHLIVATVEIAPFMLHKQKLIYNNVGANESTPNASLPVEWSGYCMDLLEELIKHLPYNVTYEIYQVADNMYGVKSGQQVAGGTSEQQQETTLDTGSKKTTTTKEPKIWNGIVGELQQGNAHLALAPLSVMAERELVIDFTVPFYDLVGSQILIKRPEVPDDYFKFLTVLDGQVWLSIGVAYLVTSAVIFLFDRLSPTTSQRIQKSRKCSSFQESKCSIGTTSSAMLLRTASQRVEAKHWPISDTTQQDLIHSLYWQCQTTMRTTTTTTLTNKTTTNAKSSSDTLLGCNYTEPTEVELHKEFRSFSFRDSLWFCITSLTPQGGGEAPSNLSGRLVAGAWWLFCFIIIASYTANLAAFLTVSRLDIPIESMDDLIKQYRINYAPYQDTADHAYFERMAYIEEIFYNIWKDMSLNETLSEEERAKFAVWDYPISDKYTKVWAQIRQAGMPRTYKEAMARVRASNLESGFALIADAMSIKYAIMTDCSLQSVGDEFSRKPVAIGVRKNLGRLRDDISQAILQLINDRFMEKLREKWWTNNPNRVVCYHEDQSESIGIKSVGGVFVIIIVGVLASFAVWSIERLIYRTKVSVSQSLIGPG